MEAQVLTEEKKIKAHIQMQILEAVVHDTITN